MCACISCRHFLFSTIHNIQYVMLWKLAHANNTTCYPIRAAFWQVPTRKLNFAVLSCNESDVLSHQGSLLPSFYTQARLCCAITMKRVRVGSGRAGSVRVRAPVGRVRVGRVRVGPNGFGAGAGSGRAGSGSGKVLPSPKSPHAVLAH